MKGAIRIMIFAALLSAYSLASHAQASRDVVPIMSFSDTSCGAWARSQSNPAVRQTYLFWFRGFVSGYNHGSQTHQVSLGAMPDNDTLALFVDKYCRDNPLNPFVSAAFPLIQERRVKFGR